ncbi:SMI1/KNR4 family protein [Larkinella sp. VNQ87]|uniref:SMI1/KNR4 family protein n=1 Tax=Larkinella sp. VNQ87 TaxID=3400921 RepID=UPI003C12472C
MYEELISNLSLNDKPNNNEFSELVDRYSSVLSSDYLEFIRLHNGADGLVGDNYLSLWPIADVLEVTQSLQADDDPYKEFVIIGSTGYFHYGVRDRVFYELDMIDRNYSKEVGNNLTDFLRTFK